MQKKRQFGWKGSRWLTFFSVGLLGVVEVEKFKRGALREKCWLEIFVEACSELWF